MNIVISQALATGMPVLTTRHSGLPEQVQDGLNGFLVEEGDFAGLADRILCLIDEPSRVTELSARARDFVQARYDSPHLIEQQIAIYERLARRDPEAKA